MKPIKLIVNTSNEKYPIYIGTNLILNTSKLLKQNSISFKKCLLVIDNKVPKKVTAKIKISLKGQKIYNFNYNSNEKNKSQKYVNKILKFLFTKNFSREDCLISIGGGITGDVTGFASSLFKRGLKFINIPTTLLSQVDSSIGGKTGINTNYGKNLIGSFYQPKLVISDSAFFKSLPQREIICGYGEILKHALISDEKFFKYLDKNFHKIINLKSPYIEKAIFKSCKIKKAIVEKDEKEKNIRKILNLGHTFAHAYEACLGYSKKLNHGEAVLLGIISALKFGSKRKFLKQKKFKFIELHYKKFNLPYDLKKYFNLNDINQILKFMVKDKKNVSRKISLVLLKKIGLPKINNEFKLNQLRIFFKNELKN